MTLGSEGATSRAPIEPVGSRSKIGAHVRPKSVVFHTPPFTAPMQKTFGWPGPPETARVRPPRNGPTFRQCISLKSPVSICWLWAREAKLRAASRRRKEIAGEFRVMNESPGFVDLQTAEKSVLAARHLTAAFTISELSSRTAFRP